MLINREQLYEAIENLEQEIMSHTKADGKLRSAFQNLNSLLNYSKISHDAFYPIWWDYRDIKYRAKDKGIKISETVAKEILELAIERHDPNIGLNWGIIDKITEEILKSI